VPKIAFVSFSLSGISKRMLCTVEMESFHWSFIVCHLLSALIVQCIHWYNASILWLSAFVQCPLSLNLCHHCIVWLQAAERFKCSSLVCVHRTEFLLHGGDWRWLTSSDGRLPRHLPLKLHNFQELNKILAHRPWALNPSLITVRVTYSLCQLVKHLEMY